ncbi:response regulator transcription factor [Undibacterium sp.]|jgi:two-component system chemotaxis response regulator CheY|uniref:response regulator n=1 Tax=Undibacterium sp. TaxID=1914977 RepID=UPI002C38C9CC|nr:response regulator transcription factor [Undibacterium sp.]HTD03566.1 response regulator transcription factor [Undibacterium sp.]
MAGQKGKSVLIVDDNEMTREVLRVILRHEGYVVVGEATDGNTGLEMALKLKPNIILLDVVMPTVNGLDVLKQIKEALPKTIILMVTSNKDRDTFTAALQSGIGGYIIKPFNAGTVTDALQLAISKAAK